MEKMEVKTSSREMIKPSSSTPLHLRAFKLALLDQLTPTIHSTLVLFYPHNTNNSGGHDHRRETSHLLKASLSSILAHYYPLAGRFKGNSSIDCNDEGAYYSEAEASVQLMEILKEPEMETINRLLLPHPMEEGMEDLLFLVQVTFFSCGGMSLGACVSHKFADGATMAAILNGWGKFAKENKPCLPPVVSAATVLPPLNHLETDDPHKYFNEGRRVLARRYVFNAAAIGSLKAMSASEEVPYPSRSEVVSALILKFSIKARKSKLGSHRSMAVNLPVNLRGRLVPPLEPHTVGNIVIPRMIQTHGDLEMSELVQLMRRGIVKIKKKYGREAGTEELVGAIFESYSELGNAMVNPEMDFYVHTSICRFPMYETDFGWGEPAWATFPNINMANIAVIMDSREAGGVEALVSFNEDDRVFFEDDGDLLEFASFNPSVVAIAKL